MGKLIHPKPIQTVNYLKEPEKNASFDTMIGLYTGIASVRL